MVVRSFILIYNKVVNLVNSNYGFALFWGKKAQICPFFENSHCGFALFLGEKTQICPFFEGFWEFNLPFFWKKNALFFLKVAGQPDHHAIGSQSWTRFAAPANIARNLGFDNLAKSAQKHMIGRAETVDCIHVCWCCILFGLNYPVWCYIIQQ